MTTEEKITTIVEGLGYVAFPNVAPAATGRFPCVVYKQITEDNSHRTHKGKYETLSLWQLSSFSSDYLEAAGMAAAIKAAFDLNQSDFRFAEVVNGLDVPDPDTSLYNKVVEVRITD